MGEEIMKIKTEKENPKELESFETINRNAAGIDIGSGSHWVCVSPSRAEENVRQFGCFTPDLMALADWLVKCKVETVAMEATGVYWIPLFQILEAKGLDVNLVNAHHVKTVPGRKSDVLDCQWLQKLHTFGLLSASFRPEDQICVLRSYIRQRQTLIKEAGTHVQRMQKALIQMNLQLHQVISDISGVTGMAMIRSIVAGERNPDKLSQLKDRRIHSSCSEIAKALTGDYREEHLFVLEQELILYDIYQQQITAIDLQIEKCLDNFESKSEQSPPSRKGKKRKKPMGNEPRFNLHGHLFRISGVDFTTIDGINVLTVQTILSEVGLDPSRFPTVKHFCSWLGLCPGSKITGGKVKSSQTRKVVNRAANAFRLAAMSLKYSRSALGAFYRRLRNRLGAPKAITATAHKLARIFYHLWTTGEIYSDPGVDFYQQQYRERMVNNLKKRAVSLGFELVAQSP
jgi:transposase